VSSRTDLWRLCNWMITIFDFWYRLIGSSFKWMLMEILIPNWCAAHIIAKLSNGWAIEHSWIGFNMFLINRRHNNSGTLTCNIKVTSYWKTFLSNGYQDLFPRGLSGRCADQLNTGTTQHHKYSGTVISLSSSSSSSFKL